MLDFSGAVDWFLDSWVVGPENAGKQRRERQRRRTKIWGAISQFQCDRASGAKTGHFSDFDWSQSNSDSQDLAKLAQSVPVLQQ